MRSSLDYAGFAQLCGRSQIMRAHNRIIPLSLQEGHPACKKLVYWHGYLSGVRCRLAYGPTDATATHCLLLQ